MPDGVTEREDAAPWRGLLKQRSTRSGAKSRRAPQRYGKSRWLRRREILTGTTLPALSLLEADDATRTSPASLIDYG